WFKNTWNKNIQDNRGKQVQYIKTTFKIWDDTTNTGFPGLWWGHYKDEIPVTGKCEAIAELDFNTYYKQYEIRLVAVRLMSESSWLTSALAQTHLVIDRRLNPQQLDDLEVPISQANILQQCPANWNDISQEYYRAVKRDRSLVLAYSPDKDSEIMAIWQQLVGIAKYLSRTQKPITQAQIQTKLKISSPTFTIGLQALEAAGFKYKLQDNYYQFTFAPNNLNSELQTYINSFLLAIKEEKFQQQYFYQVPLATINKQLLNNN
ncbi:MAG: single-stranded-DNA-specific exonuclease RecJ, partial [Waterburya sp.]